MACSCRKGRTMKKFEWTSADGAQKIVYNTELEAKAKILRKPGSSYKPLEG